MEHAAPSTQDLTLQEKQILRERGSAFLERCRQIMTIEHCDLSAARKRVIKELQDQITKQIEHAADFPCNS